MPIRKCLQPVQFQVKILKVKSDENSKLAWLDVEKLDEFVSEKDMLPIYKRLQKKAEALKKAGKI